MAVSPPLIFKTKRLPMEDWLRVQLAVLFSIAFLAFLSVFLYEAIHIHDEGAWKQVKDAFDIILPAVTGVLGTVIGFYFGKK